MSDTTASQTAASATSAAFSSAFEPWTTWEDVQPPAALGESAACAREEDLVLA